jgi:DNA invertase Pin-like site-specific DNA recombinase
MSELSTSDSPSRPARVRLHHLKRDAIVYVRQSSEVQVQQHVGSAAAQRDLAELPRKWGWAPDQIHIIDSDQGMSAKGNARRSGFEELLARIKADTVGIVIVRDLARLSRTPEEMTQLFWAAKKMRTLLYFSQTLRDLANDSVMDQVGLQIQGLFGWAENATRAHTAMTAKIALATKGIPITRPPIGYVRDANQKWIKDGRRGVADAVERLFTLFRELRSLGKVKRYLRAHDLPFPHRAENEIAWKGIDEAHIHSILRNRAYIGDYYFPYKASPGPDFDGGDESELQQEIVKRDNHPAYVSRHDWEMIQSILASHRPSIRPVVGKGDGMLQGLLYSPVSRKLFETKYWAKDGQARTARYVVRQINDWGEDVHYVAISARLIDHELVRRVLNEARAPELHAALAALQKLETTTEGREAAWQLALDEANRAVERATRRMDMVGEDDPEAHAEVVAAFKRAVKERNRVQTAKPLPPPPKRKLTPAELKELEGYCNDIEGLWKDSAITNADRKELLRQFLSQIIVLNVDREAITLNLMWRHRQPEEIRVLRPAGVAAFAVGRKTEGLDAPAITAELAEQGVITATGQRISVNVVRQKLGRVGMRTKAAWLRALAMIREDVIAKRPRRTMLDRLNTEGPSELGAWDSRRLSDVIRRLRVGVYGLEPLPVRLPSEEEADDVMRVIEEQKRLERSWAEITEHLNTVGYRPQRGERFTRALVYSLYRRAHD